MAPWQVRFEQLVEYKDIHGHCRVPMRHKQNPQLANWVLTMRSGYKKYQKGEKSPLTVKRIEKLNDLGFEWQIKAGFAPRPPRIPWQTHMGNLKKYKARFGNCRVPNKWKENTTLANWIDLTRQRYAKLQKGEKSCLTAECIDELNRLGFEWKLKPSPICIPWQTHLENLKKFKDQTGHCRVPKKWKDSCSLGNWVSHTRQEYAKLQRGERSTLTPERIAELNKLEFDWKTGPRCVIGWQTHVEHLKKYKEQTGHCRVPKKWKDTSCSLGNWVNYTRQQYAKLQRGEKSSLTAERIAELNKLGFEWKLKPSPICIPWQTHLENLKKYKEQTGHCRVPKKWKDSCSLGNWVNHNRQEYAKLRRGEQSTLTPERIAELNKLEFDWKTGPRCVIGWQTHVEHLKKYKEQTGHCRVPKKWKDTSCSLGNWVNYTRQQYAKLQRGEKSSLTAERIAELNKLGFEWKLKPSPICIPWQTHLENLKKYKEQTGHCRVPKKWKDSCSLGNWLNHNRQEYAKLQRGEQSTLTPERIAELNKLEFDWKACPGGNVKKKPCPDLLEKSPSAEKTTEHSQQQEEDTSQTGTRANGGDDNQIQAVCYVSPSDIVVAYII